MCTTANSHAYRAALFLPTSRQARQEEDFEEGEEGAAGAAGEEGGDKAAGGKFPWSGTDRDYDYEELLGGCRARVVVVTFVCMLACVLACPCVQGGSRFLRQLRGCGVGGVVGVWTWWFLGIYGKMPIGLQLWGHGPRLRLRGAAGWVLCIGQGWYCVDITAVGSVCEECVGIGPRLRAEPLGERWCALWHLGAGAGRGRDLTAKSCWVAWIVASCQCRTRGCRWTGRRGEGGG